jgi:hypothetical protein
MELKERIQKQGDLIIKTYRHEKVVTVEDFEYTIKLGAINSSKDIYDFEDIQKELIKYIESKDNGFSYKELCCILDEINYNGYFYVKNNLTF